MSDFGGKWPLKWKFSKMSIRIPRQDTELRFVGKFGENRHLRSSLKVAWFTKQKNSGSAGLVPAPILAKMGRSRPKFPERCHLLTCPRLPNLVRIGCVLPDLFWKDWFFGPKVNTIIYAFSLQLWPIGSKFNYYTLHNTPGRDITILRPNTHNDSTVYLRNSQVNSLSFS